MAIKLEMMRCFRAVAERGTLAEAAEALGRTPSAVSMTLSQFEREVGGALFEGAGKGRLTPLGRMVLDEVTEALDHFDRRLRAIEGAARAEAGVVRLAVTPSLATAIMPAVVERFRAAHAGVQIEMRDMDSRAVVEALKGERADIGLATAAETDGIARRRLFSDAFGAVVPAGHPLAGRAACGWAELSGERFISNGLCDLIPDAAFAPIREGAGLRVPNTTSLLALVRAGLGVTVLPRLALAQGETGVAFVPLEAVGTRREVHLLTRAGRPLAPAARAFADGIAAARDLWAGALQAD